jgi:DNA-binding transcriptional regulator WhiA
MDSYDRNKVQEMILASEKRLRRDFEVVVGNQKIIVDALNRIGTAVAELSAEVKAIRRDMNPQLDKPVKLPQPKKEG